ncbi:MAG: response regulator [Bdellovibrionaceae bacterium]|nr:response regulator [Pseudobdellovibrionaceae bacterium]MBX3034596.1 response regulator [Pseudobdellovibrionaceae bacterium]
MKKRILIVEDDITLEPFWISAVHKADPKAEITWVCSERDAEREIKSSVKRHQPYDLIITDLFLAGPRTGIDLWEVAGEDLRNRMVLTSGIHPEKFRRYFGDHSIAPPFLQKPYSLTETVETLRWMLDEDDNTEVRPPPTTATSAPAAL